MGSKRVRWAGVAIVASALAIVGASAPSYLFAADHLDAPGLSSPSARPDADINDLYVFGDGPGRTAIALTTHPGAGAIAPLEYATDVLYKINVDTTGDAVEDQAFVFQFGAKRASGDQNFNVVHYEGAGARSLQGGRAIVGGLTGQTSQHDGVYAFAGLRSDPFFFDLDAFRGAVLGQDNGRTFCDGKTNDFFSSLNTNGAVLSIPHTMLGGGTIKVWATTLTGSGNQIDRMGRPAINAVFNAGEDKNMFNAGQPSVDGPVFARNTGNTLRHFSSLDSEGSYSVANLNALNGVLLPDVITFDPSKPVDGVLNGRYLNNDVIDAELNIVTGGYPFDGRDAKGAITQDCVGSHADYKAGFPFLGDPHQG